MKRATKKNNTSTNTVEYDFKNNVVILGKKGFSPKKLLSLSILFFIFGLIFLLLTCALFTTGFFPGLFGSIFTILCFSLSHTYFKYRKTLLSHPSLKYKHSEFHIIMPDSFTRTATGEDWIAIYKYQNVKIYRPDTSFDEIFEYDYVDLIPEPENLYDSKAVSVVFSGNKIGYLYKGTIQDMIHDFLSRDEIIKAQVQKVEKDNIFLRIYFCKRRSEVLAPQDSFSVKLVGNTNVEMQENLALCSVGDDIDIDFSPNNDKLVVSQGPFDIGYIPTSKQEKIESLLSDNYELTGTIIDISENSNGKYTVTVNITPK